MDVEEEERVVVAKPVASRPNCSTFRSFSELLAGAINASPPTIDSSSQAAAAATVSAIRPKTLRFKPSSALNHTPDGFASSSQAEIFGAALSKSPNLPDDTKHSLIYKPMAKLVSKTTVSILANMGKCSTSQQQQQRQWQSMEASLQHLSHEKFRTYMRSSIHQTTEPCKVVQQNMEEEHKTLMSAAINGDRPSYDGYNWRKYGQKQVKGSEYPRSYFKCTHPNCPVKKKVERSFNGQIAEIVYKGEHNHSKPQPPKRNSAGTQGGSGMASDGMVHDVWSNNNHSERNWGNEGRMENQNETGLFVHSAYHVKAPQPNAGGGSPENSCGLSVECEEGSKGFEVAEEDEHRSKRRRNENQSNEAAVSEEVLAEPRVVVQSSTDSEILGDGFRWRKYGQKVVKGNPYPRSYYRCTNIKCNVRKHVERAIDDPKAFVTTYEGKHNHEMPLNKNNTPSVASEKDSQASLSKDKP